MDIRSEKLIGIEEAAKLYPEKPHHQTIRRHIREGIGPRGIRLEAVTLGKRIYTSVEAVQRFLDAAMQDARKPQYSTSAMLQPVVQEEQLHFALDVDEQRQLVLTQMQTTAMLSKLMMAAMADLSNPRQTKTVEMLVDDAMVRAMGDKGECYADAIAELTEQGIQLLRNQRCVTLARHGEPFLIMAPADTYDWASKSIDMVARVLKDTKGGANLSPLFKSKKKATKKTAKSND